MAFFKSLKRAFGFDAEEVDDDFSEGIDATVTPLKERMTMVQRQQALPGAAADAVSEGDAQAGESRGQADDGGEANRLLIFRPIVRLVNESLPEFIKSALNPEDQERYLLNALDDGMKQYLADLERRARRSYDNRWAREKTALDGQFESLREKLRKGEEDEAEAKKQQLSAERQKRALSERVHDLEKQVDSLQAENEQYLLENKSLVNKLRVCATQEKDSEEISAELNAKSAEVIKLKAEIEALGAKNEAQQIRIGELALGAEEAATTHDLSQTMVNDLQSRASEALAKADEAEARLAEASSRLAEADALAEQLRSDADSAREQAEDLRGQLAKARQQLKVVQEVREQLRQLEQDKIATDAEISELRDAAKENEALLEDLRDDIRRKNTALAQRDERLRQAEEEKHRLEDLADSLRKTIETNLHHQAQSEALLRSEIDRMKNIATSDDKIIRREAGQSVADGENVADAVAATREESLQTSGFADHDSDPALNSDFSDFNAVPAATLHPAVTDVPEQSAAAPKPGRTRVKKVADKRDAAKPKISAIDESIDSTNWLIATPPASRKAKADTDAAATDNEFGYQEPTRRQPPESPAQMLLW